MQRRLSCILVVAVFTILNKAVCALTYRIELHPQDKPTYVSTLVVTEWPRAKEL